MRLSFSQDKLELRSPTEKVLTLIVGTKTLCMCMYVMYVKLSTPS